MRDCEKRKKELERKMQRRKDDKESRRGKEMLTERGQRETERTTEYESLRD